jgi:hypothetical protein
VFRRIHEARDLEKRLLEPPENYPETSEQWQKTVNGGLPSSESLDQFVGVGKPRQTQNSNDHNLPDNRKTVDQKGKASADDRCFD